MSDQLALFAVGAGALGTAPRPQPADPATTTLAARLPPGLALGTSSWSFTGWAGLVYAGRHEPGVLARDGLAAYAAHPLFRAVGLDRTYYAPLAAAELARYRASVPPGFAFLVKAHADLTTPWRRANGRATGNPRFLDADHAMRAVVDPTLEGLADRLGAIVFQFPPLRQRHVGSVRAFAERLHAFLDRLPHGPCYGVELRNVSLTRPEVVDAIHAAGATWCYSVHPAAPSVAEQRAIAAAAKPGSGPLLVRWNLRAGESYEGAKARFAPFDRLEAEDPDTRAAIAALAAGALAAGRPVIAIANNKAEGSAPLTIARLAAAIADELEDPT